MPPAPVTTQKRVAAYNSTLHEGRRRENLRSIDEQNAKFAKKLMFIKSSIPARKSLNKEFNLHKKTKELRCKWPIIDMKKNVFNREMSKQSSEFSMKYDISRFEQSP